LYNEKKHSADLSTGRTLLYFSTFLLSFY